MSVEDDCENSTERDFEDYFAANAPVDALSKMEKAVQLLETIETEELRRTEQAMVSSALKSLRHSLQRWHRFRDEDTAVDRGETSPSFCAGTDASVGGESAAASETLEPAAWRVACECEDRWIHILDSPDDLPFVPDYCPDCESDLKSEPLVRPDQLFDRLMRIVEEHRHRAEDASAAGNEKERYACESVADVIRDEVMQWKLQIKETQGESGGS